MSLAYNIINSFSNLKRLNKEPTIAFKERLPTELVDEVYDFIGPKVDPIELLDELENCHGRIEECFGIDKFKPSYMKLAQKLVANNEEFIKARQDVLNNIDSFKATCDVHHAEFNVATVLSIQSMPYRGHDCICNDGLITRWCVMSDADQLDIREYHSDHGNCPLSYNSNGFTSNERVDDEFDRRFRIMQVRDPAINELREQMRIAQEASFEAVSRSIERAMMFIPEIPVRDNDDMPPLV